MVYEIYILSKGSYSIFDSNDTLACDDVMTMLNTLAARIFESFMYCPFC